MDKRILTLSLIASAVASACTSESPVVDVTFCTRELRVQFSPADTTIPVGQDFRPFLSLSSCGGAERLTDVVNWRSDDVTIAAVDPISGAVVGKSAGQTSIVATGQRYGAVGSIHVAVEEH